MTERMRPDASDLRNIVRAFGESTLAELSLDLGGSRLQLSKAGPPPAPPAPGRGPAVAPGTVAQPSAGPGSDERSAAGQLSAAGQPSAAPRLVAVPAPTVGVFHVRRSADDARRVEPGASIAAGEEIGTVVQPSGTVPVTCDVDGIVAACPVDDGQFVEYGQLLISVEVVDPS